MTKTRLSCIDDKRFLLKDRCTRLRTDTTAYPTTRTSADTNLCMYILLAVKNLCMCNKDVCSLHIVCRLITRKKIYK